MICAKCDLLITYLVCQDEVKSIFFVIFQGLLSARNCPAPLTILAIKRVHLCNLAKKNLRATVLWDIAARL